MNTLGNNWADAEHIVIVDNIPYYRVNGNTYCDVYKNGLSLDELCIMLPCDFPDTRIHVESQIETSVSANPRLYYTDQCDERDTYVSNPRNSKKTKKMRAGKKRMRKTSYRVKGNDYKVGMADTMSIGTELEKDFELLEMKLNEELREKTWLKWWQIQEKEMNRDDINKWEDMDRWMDPDMYAQTEDW
jgi:hypothetical protein